MTTTARLNALALTLNGRINEGLREGVRRAFMHQGGVAAALTNLATQANSEADRAKILALADAFVTEEGS